jgi:hypothetical protein
VQAKRAGVIAIFIAVLALCSATAAAQSERASDGPLSRKCRLCGTDELELELGVPLWLPSVTGSFASGQAGDPDSDFGKHLRFDSTLRFALMGRLRMRAGPWGVLVDTFGAQIVGELGFNFGQGELGHVDLAGGILRLAASYQLPALEFGKPERPLVLRFVPYAGTRFYRIGGDFESPVAAFEDKWTWWDPIVGLGMLIDFRVGLVLRSEADAGGFGAGNDIAWWFASALEYGIADWMGISLGWNFVRFEQETGSGSHQLDLTLSMSGPVLALSFYMQTSRARPPPAQNDSPSVK